MALGTTGKICFGIDGHTHSGLAFHGTCEIVGSRIAHHITDKQYPAIPAVRRSSVIEARRQMLLRNKPLMVESRRDTVDIPFRHCRE